MKRAAEEQEFEQAANFRNRLKAVRSLLERQRVSNAAVGTLDAIAVAAEGTDANAQVFQVRDGVLADRQSFYLENAARARRGRGGGGVHPPVLRQRALGAAAGDRPAASVENTDTLAEALTERRGAPVEVRYAERGDKRRILELARAQRTLRARPGPAALRAPPQPAHRGAGGTPERARHWSRSRCGSSASTSRT